MTALPVGIGTFAATSASATGAPPSQGCNPNLVPVGLGEASNVDLIAPIKDTINSTGLVSSSSAETVNKTVVGIPNLDNILIAGALTANVHLIVGGAEGSASVAALDIGPASIVADGVTATSTSDCQTSFGTTEIAYLKIGAAKPLLNYTPAPNTVISLGALGRVVLNEQTQTSQGLNVNAIHVELLNNAVNVVVSQALSNVSQLLP